MKIVALLFWLGCVCLTTAQAQSITASIKDAKTNESLAFVNVGIVGKSTGTVSNETGQFRLLLQNNNADSLRISMVGYQPKTYMVADFLKQYSQNQTILLQPQVRELKEVKVVNRVYKESVLGNRTRSKTTDAGFTSNRLGNEIGIVIKLKKSPTYLKQFNASLAVAPTDSVKLRLNFYDLKDGLPNQLIQQQNIFVTVHKGQEMITVDLEPYHLMVNDKFFVSLEWIKNAHGHGLMFSASLLSSPIISRETSQANWEKIGIAGIGFNVLAEY